MRKEITVVPLENEFWPLEGVSFDEGDTDPVSTVTCRIKGDERFRGRVELRFLAGDEHKKVAVHEAESLYAVALSARVSLLNRAFYGFGLVFQEDVDTGGVLTVEVEGSRRYSFLVVME